MTPTRTVTQVRPDALTALLGQIWDEALDPGYAEAAAGRSTANVADDRRGVKSVLALALVGFVLAVAAVSTSAGRPAVAQQRAKLVERVQQQTAAYDQAVVDLTALQAEVDALKQRRLATTGNGNALSSELRVLSILAAQTQVTGPGIVATLDDGDGTAGQISGDPTLGRVLDRDLQLVVNGLWDSGAEAISVNGVRLTTLSSIRSAGDAILVDYRPLTRPYRVAAIGDPRTIEARFTSGSGGRGLRTLSEAYGVRFGIAADPALVLPASASVTLRYARQPSS